MRKGSFKVHLLSWLYVCSALGGNAVCEAQPKSATDADPAWRRAAARVLEARGDAGSLATAAALSFVGPSSRSRSDAAKAAEAALELADKASDVAPNDPAMSWLRLQFCAAAPLCDIRDAATTMRWVDADNGAAWLPTLAAAQKEKDAIEVDRVLDDMAQSKRFDLYGNRITVMMFDTLKAARRQLPAHYLKTDVARLSEAIWIAGSAFMPSFSPLINLCRDAAARERRDSCLQLSKTMQRSDTIMAQLVGFAIEKRLTRADAQEYRTIAERRRLLEWRAASAKAVDNPLLPWLGTARARSRLAKMRTLPREEDVSIALLNEHAMPLDPPEDRR
jgi:hypothetical protein